MGQEPFGAIQTQLENASKTARDQKSSQFHYGLISRSRKNSASTNDTDSVILILTLLF